MRMRAENIFYDRVYPRMEFASRSKCIEHFQDQFPNLPRYMVEMALDYDLSNGAVSNEKPQTGKERRKAKKHAKEQALQQKDTSFQEKGPRSKTPPLRGLAPRHPP